MCQGDVCLKELVQSIHLNPVRADLVPNLEKPDRYAYCGHSALMGSVGQNRLQTGYILTSISKNVLLIWYLNLAIVRHSDVDTGTSAMSAALISCST